MARRKITLPYLVLGSRDVHADPVDGWALLTAVEGVPPTTLRDGDIVESWDGLSHLVFRRSFWFERDAEIRLGLVPGSARFSFVVTSVTAGGLLRDVLFRQDFGAELQGLDVTVRPEGIRLAGSLGLVAQLLIISAEAADNMLAPTFSGARAWEDSIQFQLEGGRGRVPMEVLSFRVVFPGQGFESALYHVEFAPYPDLDIEETVRVYLNSDNPSFVAAVERREPVASALLWGGVVRRLILSALLGDILSDTDVYPEGSMGLNLRRWLRQGFPAMDLPSIKMLASSDPSTFEAMLDSWTGIGRGAFPTAGQG